MAFSRRGYLNLYIFSCNLILITFWPSSTNFAPSPNNNFSIDPGTGSRSGLFRLLP